MDTDDKPSRWNWRWAFVALSLALLIFWVVSGVMDGWNTIRSLGVVAMTLLAISFLLQIRDVRRKDQAQAQAQGRMLRDVPRDQDGEIP